MNYYPPDNIYYTSYACHLYPRYPNVPFPLMVRYNAPVFCVNAHKKQTKIGDNPIFKCDLDFARPRTFLMTGNIGDDEFKEVELNVKRTYQDTSTVNFKVDFSDLSMKNKISNIYIYFNITNFDTNTYEIVLFIKYIKNDDDYEIYLTTPEYPCQNFTWTSTSGSSFPASLEFTMKETI